MKRILVFSLLTLLLSTAFAQVKLATVDDLRTKLEFQDGQIVVFNFWATWCRPCVKELPAFDDVGTQLKEQGVEMILISLDALDRLETNVKPLVQKQQLKSMIWLLDEPDFNSWLNLVSEQWSGAIPATIVIDGIKKERRFHEGELSKEELMKLIKTEL